MALLLLLSILLTACGSAVPKEIVKQALSYRIDHPASRPLVGYEQLQQHSQLLAVQIHRDRTQDILLTDSTSLTAHHLWGSYDVRIQPTPDRHYLRNHLPFQLTLAVPDPETSEWILLEPVATTDPQQWRPVSFLPPPPPPEPEETLLPEPSPSAEPMTEQTREESELAAQDIVVDDEETSVPLTVTEEATEIPVDLPKASPPSSPD
jgi:hypothetical protein